MAHHAATWQHPSNATTVVTRAAVCWCRLCAQHKANTLRFFQFSQSFSVCIISAHQHSEWAGCHTHCTALGHCCCLASTTNTAVLVLLHGNKKLTIYVN